MKCIPKKKSLSFNYQMSLNIHYDEDVALFYIFVFTGKTNLYGSLAV
jgi:hypothetical protein